MVQNDDLEERSRRRMQTWQFEAGDASGAVVAKSSGTLQLHKFAFTAEESLFYLQALHDLRCQFYPEVAAGQRLDKSKVFWGSRS